LVDLSNENDSNFHKRVRFWLDSLRFFVEKDVALLVIASHFDFETYDVLSQFTQLEIVLNEYKQYFELYDVLRFGIDPHSKEPLYVYVQEIQKMLQHILDTNKSLCWGAKYPLGWVFLQEKLKSQRSTQVSLFVNLIFELLRKM
jgi:hypothetical protein